MSFLICSCASKEASFSPVPQSKPKIKQRIVQLFPFAKKEKGDWRELPPGLVDRIMRFLKPPELANLTATCRKFSYIETNHHWKKLYAEYSFKKFDDRRKFRVKPPKGHIYPSSFYSKKFGDSLLNVFGIADWARFGIKYDHDPKPKMIWLYNNCNDYGPHKFSSIKTTHKWTFLPSRFPGEKDFFTLKQFCARIVPDLSIDRWSYKIIENIWEEPVSNSAHGGWLLISNFFYRKDLGEGYSCPFLAQLIVFEILWQLKAPTQNTEEKPWSMARISKKDGRLVMVRYYDGQLEAIPPGQKMSSDNGMRRSRLFINK